MENNTHRRRGEISKNLERGQCIVFIAWKDIKHPVAGGAEYIHHIVSKGLLEQGHSVIHITPGFKGCVKKEYVDGVLVHRVGNSVLFFYILPFIYLYKYASKTDILIDCFNCVGSFLGCMPSNTKKIFLIHHIQGVIWRYQQSFSGVPKIVMYVISTLGHFVEEIQLRLYSLCVKQVITVSESTKGELVSLGFESQNISIISESAPEFPAHTQIDKYEQFTVVSIGMRSMKQPLQLIQAFEKFQKFVPDAQLVILGAGDKKDEVDEYISSHGIKNVILPGFVSEEEKAIYLSKSHVFVTTSIKEGWGLVVIEANAMGLPVIGYDVPGVRDAVSFNNGVLVPLDQGPEGISLQIQNIYELSTHKPEEYKKYSERVLDVSMMFDKQKTIKDFINVLYG